MMARTARQKINKEIEDVKNTTNQLDLTDIYMTLYPTTIEYTFLSSIHGTFFRIEHILGNKVSLDRF